MVLVTDFKLLLLIATVSGIHGYQPSITGFGPVLAHCCNIGSTWAKNHTSCTGPQSPIPEITPNDIMVCYSAIYICCVRSHRDIDCERGKQAAQSGGTCPELPAIGHEARPPGEAYKDCCIGCSLGLKAGSLRMPCTSGSNFAFGSPWDKSYEDCCFKISPDPGTSQHAGGCKIHDPCSQICEEREGNIRCSCYPGYELSSDQKTCEDINECQLGIDSCNHTIESCVNAIGGFQCVFPVHPKGNSGPTIGSCPAGFYRNPTTARCDDIDECARGACNPATEVCVNSIGSFTCSPRNTPGCPPGFKLQQNTGRCIDVDECAEGKHECQPEHEQCVNSFGSYQCQPKPAGVKSCLAGFKWSDVLTICEDVNECTEHLDDCDSMDEECRNTIGGYECDPRCAQGMRFEEHQQQCVDIDECIESLHNCRPGETCLNTSPNYRCVSNITMPCPPGYKPIPAIDGTPPSCVDVDECEEALHACDAESEICVNGIGSYSCEIKHSTEDQPLCPAGYIFIEDHCEDIDECARNLHNCSKDSQICVNRFGGFGCFPKPSCIPGFTFSVEQNSCIDVDECSERSDVCHRETQDCINTEGSYRCVSKVVDCSPGYRRTAGGSCEDINECIERTDDCDKERQYCVNTQGSYQCHTKVPPVIPKCGIGYRLDHGTNSCKDINECEEIRPCLADQMCDNTQGSYICRCRQGYQLDSVTRTCKDVNECQIGFHTCVGSQRCDNTIGSFTCVRTTSCGTGYTLNAGTNNCEDDDECSLGSHNCGPGFVCRNTLGSFRCDRVRCPTGQRLLPDGSCQVITCSPGMELDPSGNCIDINECTLSNSCRMNQRCINTVGSYRCQNMLNCGPGFELNEVGNQCVDVDECARRIHECTSEQVCRNRPGGYTCECPAGHSLNAQRKCEDIDECTRFRGQICSANSECQNTPGSYICNCKEGFTKDENGRNCVDIDECENTPNICHQKCFNSWGSYHCVCNSGYRLASDGRTCQDIDECSEVGGKLCIGLCVNEPGSYSCSCPDGYRLSSDKYTCQDIDECQEQNVCKGENEVCLNTRGSFECNTIICPPNYERDRDHRNRCKRTSVECRQGDAECLKDPLSVSYNYITFVSNMRIPPSGQLDLFTMRGPRFTFTTVQFSLDLKDARAGYGTVSATREYFHLRRTAFNEAMVSLVKPIPGPQEIELQLTMRMYHNGLFGGIAVARIFIFVTAHQF